MTQPTALAGLTLGETTHHVDRRIPCKGCGTRVFNFAPVTDEDGREVTAYCAHCADRLRGVKLCQYCQRPIVEGPDLEPGKVGKSLGAWVHQDGRTRNHTPAPEREWNFPPLVPQPQQPLDPNHRRLQKFGGGK